jgi:hypothetical protein
MLALHHGWPVAEPERVRYREVERGGGVCLSNLNSIRLHCRGCVLAKEDNSRAGRTRALEDVALS